ncbi:MAG: hypothetical protein JW945_02300 [Methanomicrobia archaeon]|nr:hypothetical protein [Methanomicrobia archaeon]
MTERPYRAPKSFVLVQDEVPLRGKKKAKMVCIVESEYVPPDDLKETIESLIEAGLSRLETMRTNLLIIEDLLRRDGRFDDLAHDVGRYREIVFKESRSVPFTMIEARAVMTTMRKWQAMIARRLAEHRVFERAF